MEQAQLAPLQIRLAAMGIEQGTRARAGACQHQGHGVDREVAPGQIVCQGPKAHLGVLGGHGVAFLPGRGHIQQQGLGRHHKLQLHRAVGAMDLAAADRTPKAPLGQLLRQLLHQGRPTALHHQIQIEQPAPGIVMHPVQQQIPHPPPTNATSPTPDRLRAVSRGAGMPGIST